MNDFQQNGNSSSSQSGQTAQQAVQKPEAEQKPEATPLGLSFQGGKNDLGLDPGNFFNRTLLVKKIVKTKIDEHEIEFGEKQIEQVREDLKKMYENPSAVKKSVGMFSAFQSYAGKKGYANKDIVALAIQHYAATNEFIEKVEKEEKEDAE